MKDNKSKEEKHGINPVAAAAAGAVVGAAAVGIAGVAALANKNSRKKMEKMIDDTKSKVGDKLNEGQEKVKNIVAIAKRTKQDLVKSAK